MHSVTINREQVFDSKGGWQPLHRYLRSLLVGGALTVTFPGIVLANDRLPTEDDYFATIPTVSSASRLQKSILDTGMSVTIIDRETIEASPAIEIPDLLRLVPGLQVAHATGSVFAVGYHGANDQWPRRMEVMVDGRSVYLNTTSSVEWNALGIAKEDIERIEVVRGPNSPTFGSNAVLGSINIITRAPFFQSGTYLRTTLGSQDTANTIARWGGKLGDWESVLNAQYRSDDGFDNVNDQKRVTDLRLPGNTRGLPQRQSWHHRRGGGCRCARGRGVGLRCQIRPGPRSPHPFALPAVHLGPAAD